MIIPDETLEFILAKTNPVRTERIEYQVSFWGLYCCVRTLRRALRNRRKRAGMYIMAQGRSISPKIGANGCNTGKKMGLKTSGASGNTFLIAIRPIITRIRSLKGVFFVR